MGELREIFEESGVSILNENKEKGTINILASWGKAGVENKNKRTYLQPLLQREIDRVQKSVEEGSFIGTGDHPGSGQADIATTSHIVNKLWLDDSGKCWAEMKILGTERGKNIQEIIKNGGRLGLSSRSFGTVKNGIVQDDLKLQGIDIVMNPSAPGATFNKENIFESVDFSVEKKEEKIQSKVTIADIYMEARIAGVDPAKYAKKINKEVDSQNESLLDDNDEQINFILKEAVAAGADISNPAVKKKILKNFIRQKNEPGKGLTEKQKAKIKEQEEGQKYDYLVGEKMAAGYKGK